MDVYCEFVNTLEFLMVVLEGTMALWFTRRIVAYLGIKCNDIFN